MRILLIGNGAREHCIGEAIAKSARKPRLFVLAASRNPGLEQLATVYNQDTLDDVEGMLYFAKKSDIDIAVIGPEAPLALGVVDVLERDGIPCVGPRKALAQIESSKSFARSFLEREGVPGGLRYKSFTRIEGVKEFMESLSGNVVVKADGLAGGKGVKIVGEQLTDVEAAIGFVHEVLQQHPSVVIEEKLVGQEFSLMSFVDGDNHLPMPIVQDHKRAHEGDTGPNTGGMGTYSMSDHGMPFLTEEDVREAHNINYLTMQALKKEIGMYKGVLFGGFMKTRDGVRLIEYNARFGDPEVMSVLPLLEIDFVDICEAIIRGGLEHIALRFARKATVCKYLVPEGYPDAPLKGEKIVVPDGLPARVYYGSVHASGDDFVLDGSRSVAMVGVADTIEEAERIAESSAQAVQGPVFHRKDIGTQALIQKRVDMVQEWKC